MKRVSNKYTLTSLLLLVAGILYAQKPQVTLKINDEDSARIHHDEFALFTVSVANKNAQFNQRWNMAADRQLSDLEDQYKDNKISKEEYEKEKKNLEAGKKPVSRIVIGSQGGSWTNDLRWKVTAIDGKTVSLPLKVFPDPANAGVLNLDDQLTVDAFVGIDPSDVRSVPAGVYTIELSFGSAAPASVRLEILSRELSLTEKKSEGSLYSFGNYYLLSGDLNKAMSYADQLLQDHPSSLAGLTLRGDVQIGQRSYAGALDTFSKALQEYNKRYPRGEVPIVYIEKIDWLKRQLGN